MITDSQDILECRINPLLSAMEQARFVIFPKQPQKHPYELTSGRVNVGSGTPTATVTNKTSSKATLNSTGVPNTTFISFPIHSRREPGVGWTLNEFLRVTIDQANRTSGLLQQLSDIIFEATEDYVATILADFDEFVDTFIEYNYQDRAGRSSNALVGESIYDWIENGKYVSREGITLIPKITLVARIRM